MKKIALLATIAAGALLALPAVSNAANFRGVVIVKQAKRHALLVASPNGKVRTVRTTRMRIHAGARVTVRARLLRDGTFKATRIALRGRAHRAHVRAVVVRKLRTGRLVSAGHSVFKINTGRRRASAMGAGNDPQPGDVVDETVQVGENGELDEEDVNEVGETENTELEGKIVSVTAPTATEAGKIVLKTEHGTELTVNVPAGMQLPALKEGDRVELRVKVEADKSFTLVKVQQEDDENDDDGDNNDDDGDNDEGEH
ncbi:MAG: hypothetical protein M3R26_00725 [Actinomycetota bacterium]|nr:hypothetical protein [Actinomycetota bacterium]MDQ2982536.1 hypothetical protein [Actinomycetota bacterium]